ncbi:MAG: hypothetical protein HDS73_03225 [Bacteroidales bacterium]|nr:hypothetical protein [Bacteroidales bacterium]
MEFGSDFHIIDNLPKGTSLLELLATEANLYADGRQPIECILQHEKIQRLWVPSYHCHDSLAGLHRNGYELNYYNFTPGEDLEKAISSIPIEQGDAVMVINHFGLSGKPEISDRDFILIEDHSHDLISDWARTSDADWCFASLRKTLPIADGGILWSPRRKALPAPPQATLPATENSERRYEAMRLKARYLKGGNVQKEDYLKIFRETEERFDSLPISAISQASKEIISALDIRGWYQAKKENWDILRKSISSSKRCKVIEAQNIGGTPFSLILLFDNTELRDRVRAALIENNVFPAILWSIPDNVNRQSEDFGRNMLSIHCDGRYNSDHIKRLAMIINTILSNDTNN